MSKKLGLENISYPTQNFLQADLKSVYSFGIFMCKLCGLNILNKTRITYQFNNHLQNQIFQDVMRTTANSAMAWQTFLTNVGRMAYHEMHSYFDVADTPMISWYQNA